jgi:hypothetical protein
MLSVPPSPGLRKRGGGGWSGLIHAYRPKLARWYQGSTTARTGDVCPGQRLGPGWHGMLSLPSPSRNSAPARCFRALAGA